jgi:hypothetical protein
MYDLNPASQEKKTRLLSSVLFRIVIAFLSLLCIVVVIFVMPHKNPFLDTSCATQVKVYREKIKPILYEWGDATELASKSSRISIVPQVANLQALKRKLDIIEPGSCVATAHTSLSMSMNEEIEGFLSFMAQEADGTVSGHMQLAKMYGEMAANKFDIAANQ